MVSVRAGQSTGETGMRLPSGFVAANVWPKTSPCGSVAMWTHCETQLVKVLSTVEAGPVLITARACSCGGRSRRRVRCVWSTGRTGRRGQRRKPCSATGDHDRTCHLFLKGLLGLQASKLLRLLPFLQTRQRMPTTEHAERLEVSRRTVLRDVAALKVSSASDCLRCMRRPRARSPSVRPRRPGPRT